MEIDMPKILYESNKTKSVTVVVLSNDWFSFKPWEHKGKPVRYLDYVDQISDSGNVRFKYFYIGPISIVRAIWLDKNR
jgi:hypothetical protein